MTKFNPNSCKRHPNNQYLYSTSYSVTTSHDMFARLDVMLVFRARKNAIPDRNSDGSVWKTLFRMGWTKGGGSGPTNLVCPILILAVINTVLYLKGLPASSLLKRGGSDKGHFSRFNLARRVAWSEREQRENIYYKIAFSTLTWVKRICILNCWFNYLTLGFKSFHLC